LNYNKIKGLNYSLNSLNKLFINKDIKIYILLDMEHETIFQMIKKFKKKLSFVDYTVIYLALKNNGKVLCFDNQILKIIKINLPYF